MGHCCIMAHQPAPVLSEAAVMELDLWRWPSWRSCLPPTLQYWWSADLDWMESKTCFLLLPQVRHCGRGLICSVLRY